MDTKNQCDGCGILKQVKGWWVPDADDEVHHDDKNNHDPQLFEIIDQHTPGYNHVVDIGGNVGKWSSHFAEKFSKVSTFEPAPYHIECFKLNCQQYKNIDLYEFGLSNQHAKGKLDVFIKGHLGSTRILDDEQGNIQMKTLDSMSFDRIDVLKIDVEGRELHVLEGAEQTLKRLSPLIVIERCVLNSSAFGYDKKATDDILQSYGYKMIYKLTRDCVYKK